MRIRIRRKVQKIVETSTGRRCEKCKHFDGLFCKSPKGWECGKSIFPIGFEKKEKGGKEQ